MSLTCDHLGAVVTLDRVVVDTGAAITVLDESKLLAGGIILGEPVQHRRMIGTGGAEFAKRHKLQRVAIENEIQVIGFAPHVGPAQYGHDLGGLLGLDFLELTGAIIKLTDWTIDFAPAVQSAG